MGLMESIGKALSGLFASSTAKAVAQWEEHMTLAQIDDLERKGCDVTVYRQHYEEREAKKRKLRQDSLDAMNLEALKEYQSTPRDIAGNAFVDDVINLNGFAEKRKSCLVDAPLVYGAVVQAHGLLFKPGKEERCGIVFVFALDEAHRYDIEWLTHKAKQISNLKNGVMVPKDSVKFIETLRNDQSYFCFKLGASLSDGADVWCATYTLDHQEKLPLGFIPANRIIPFLLHGTLKENRFAPILLIPVSYYTK